MLGLGSLGNRSVQNSFQVTISLPHILFNMLAWEKSVWVAVGANVLDVNADE